MTPEQHTMLDRIETARKSFNETIVDACKLGVVGDYEFVTNVEGHRGIPQVSVSYSFMNYIPAAPKRVFE